MIFIDCPTPIVQNSGHFTLQYENIASSGIYQHVFNQIRVLTQGSQHLHN